MKTYSNTMSILELKPAIELRSVFKRCHNYIYGNQGLPKDRAFHELLKVIFCKIYDERKNSKITFYIDESGNNSKQNLNERITDLFNLVKKEHPKIYQKYEKIELDDRVLQFIVKEFQNFSFIDTKIDIKGAAYEELIGSNLRGDRGEFFTPRNVCLMAVEMLFHLHPKKTWKDLKIIDSSCGTGGFLIAVIDFLKKQSESSTMNDKTLSKTVLKQIIENNIFGLDINPLLTSAAEMNEIFHINTSGKLFTVNSLLPKLEWNNADDENINFGTFDLLFTNPPFGSLIPIDDPDILSQYDLGHTWKKVNNAFVKTTKLRLSAPPEQLFVERCIQFLKPGGKMAIVLPDSILSNPGLKFIRNWIFKKTKIIACVDLPIEIFQPFVGAKTNVVFLEKKLDDDDEEPYEIFMASAQNIGHDRRGNPIHKRDEEGKEILLNQQLVLDDDMPKITREFKKWRSG